MDIKCNTLKNIEIGYTYPKSNTLVLLCKALNVSANYLLGLSDDNDLDNILNNVNHILKYENVTINGKDLSSASEH